MKWLSPQFRHSYGSKLTTGIHGEVKFEGFLFNSQEGDGGGAAMIRSLLFLGLQNSVLDLPLNRLAAILHLHLSGGVQGWVYGAEMLLLFLTLFFFI